MSEEIKALADLGVAALALIAVIIFARTVYTRSKSDASTIKVFADLLSNSFTTISENVQGHGDESATRHLEIVSTLQIMSELLLQHINSGNDVSQTVKELSDNIGAYKEEVKQAGVKIMDTMQPLDQILTEIRDELQELRASVDTHLTNFKDDVATKTAEIEVRLLQVEKRATQEMPAIAAVEEIKHLQATETEEQTDKVKTIPIGKESKS